MRQNECVTKTKINNNNNHDNKVFVSEKNIS